MIFESPKKKRESEEDKYSYLSPLQFTPTFKIQQTSSVIKIYFNYGKAINTPTPNSEQTYQSLTVLSPCRTDVNKVITTASISKRLQLSSNLSKVYTASFDISSMKSKLRFIYNQFTKENDKWKEAFNAFCMNENMNLEQLKVNTSLTTYTEKQSFIYSNEFFWLLAIFYIRNTKNNFSFEDLVALTNFAIEVVKNSSLILNKCYLELAKEFKSKEKLQYCIKKCIPYVNDNHIFKLLNDDRHTITKEDGSLIKAKNTQSKRVKLFNDIRNVSIASNNKENNRKDQPKGIIPFIADDIDDWI